MSRACQVCGGLVVASNEVIGYGGPLCNGSHGLMFNDGNYLMVRIQELENRVTELTQELATWRSKTQRLPLTHTKSATRGDN